MHNPRPAVGKIVHAIVDPAENNGSDIAPAIITRLWSPLEAGADSSGEGAWCVSYRILYDGDQVGWASSAYLFTDEQTARSRTTTTQRAFWPVGI